MQLIDLYPYPVHAAEHLPNGIDPLPLATTTDPGWMGNEDKTKLDAISPQAKKVESSTTNGNIKIDGTETQVYRHQTYVHDQTTASTLWAIDHNLNRYPSVTVVDPNGYVFVPDTIRYIDANRIEIGFTQNETGKVFLN
jgi:3D (Asp-Asp-Asp) domain-containing protein